MKQIPYMDPAVARRGCLIMLACTLAGAAISYLIFRDASFPSNVSLGAFAGLAIGAIAERLTRRLPAGGTPAMRFVRADASDPEIKYVTPRSAAADEWEQRLAETARQSPMLAQQLAEVMWLDDYLMAAIKRSPGVDHPEMIQAWNLCIQIAEEISLPPELGPDWVSNHATPVGKRLGLTPIKPAPRARA